MRKNRSVRQNTLSLLFSRLTAQGLAIIFVAILARRFGVETFGRFTFFAALVLIGNTFTNFGTDTYLIREISRAGKITSLLPSAFGLQIVLSSLWWLATMFLQPEPELLLYALVLFPLAMISISTSSLRALERMDLVWTISLANGTFQILAALFSNDLWTLCVYLLVGQLFLAGISYWLCTLSLKAFQLFPINHIRPLLRATLPFAMLTILLVLSQRLGILSVSLLLGDSSTGLFASVARVVDGLKLGHYAVLGALLPVISRGTREAKQSFRSGFGMLMGLSLIVAIGLSLFPGAVILILYGNDFSQAIGLLAILGWSLLPYTISSFISYDLISRGKELTLVKATTVSLSVILVLYLWLISIYGLNGAIYATLLGEVFQAVIFIYFGRRSGTTISNLATKESLK